MSLNSWSSSAKNQGMWLWNMPLPGLDTLVGKLVFAIPKSHSLAGPRFPGRYNGETVDSQGQVNKRNRLWSASPGILTPALQPGRQRPRGSQMLPTVKNAGQELGGRGHVRRSSPRWPWSAAVEQTQPRRNSPPPAPRSPAALGKILSGAPGPEVRRGLSRTPAGRSVPLTLETPRGALPALGRFRGTLPSFVSRKLHQRQGKEPGLWVQFYRQGDWSHTAAEPEPWRPI